MSYWPRNFDRPQWDFAKQLGVESLIGEPKEDQFDAIEKLCDEYGFKFAIHNHPKSQSHYWNPDTVLKVCRGRSTHRRLLRHGPLAAMGIDPLEAVKNWKAGSSAFTSRT